MKTMGKIYVIGKIVGEDPEICRAKFTAIETKLSATGFQVVNPMEHRSGGNFKADMRTCTAIYVLPCSKESPGANLKVDFAIKTGADIFYNLKDVEQWTSSRRTAPTVKQRI